MLCVLPSVVLLRPDSGLNCLNRAHLLVPMWHIGFRALDTEDLCNFWHDQRQLGNQWISCIYSYHSSAMKVQSMFLVSVYLLGLLICFCPSDTVWGFFYQDWVVSPVPEPKTWRTGVTLFIWQFTRHLSATDGPTSSKVAVGMVFSVHSSGKRPATVVR